VLGFTLVPVFQVSCLRNAASFFPLLSAPMVFRFTSQRFVLQKNSLNFLSQPQFLLSLWVCQLGTQFSLSPSCHFTRGVCNIIFPFPSLDAPMVGPQRGHDDFFPYPPSFRLFCRRFFFPIMLRVEFFFPSSPCGFSQSFFAVYPQAEHATCALLFGCFCAGCRLRPLRRHLQTPFTLSQCETSANAFRPPDLPSVTFLFLSFVSLVHLWPGRDRSLSPRVCPRSFWIAARRAFLRFPATDRFPLPLPAKTVPHPSGQTTSTLHQASVRACLFSILLRQTSPLEHPNQCTCSLRLLLPPPPIAAPPHPLSSSSDFIPSDNNDTSA